ncbi:DUF6090 family protein [Flagellimonas sp. DF-77]|uniref:DUF6090 family protein n=1 Tax=Flagellimonas algarum TaxID=3230298 RepID=UPI003392A9EE
MIKFFRRIRKRLLNDNKFSKYLLYAVGEIILVVIGILIALQVNNWNDARLERNKEQEYLIEIKQNLEKDTTNINQAIAFYQRKAILVNETFGLFGLGSEGKPYIDQLLPKMDTLTSFEVYIPVRTAFDNMVAAETVDLIQNKALRTALSTYYSQLDYKSGTQERAKEASRQFTDEISPKMMSRELIQLYLGQNVAYPALKDISIHSDPMVASKLFTLYMNATILIKELEQQKAEIETILNQIDPMVSDP